MSLPSTPGASCSISHYTTHVTVPDSITTWQFVAVSIKTGQGDPTSPVLRKQENNGPDQPPTPTPGQLAFA